MIYIYRGPTHDLVGQSQVRPQGAAGQGPVAGKVYHDQTLNRWIGYIKYYIYIYPRCSMVYIFSKHDPVL